MRTIIDQTFVTQVLAVQRIDCGILVLPQLDQPAVRCVNESQGTQSTATEGPFQAPVRPSSLRPPSSWPAPCCRIQTRTSRVSTISPFSASQADLPPAPMPMVPTVRLIRVSGTTALCKSWRTRTVVAGRREVDLQHPLPLTSSSRTAQSTVMRRRLRSPCLKRTATTTIRLPTPVGEAVAVV